MKIWYFIFCLLVLLPFKVLANTPVGAVLIVKGVVTASVSNSGLRTLSKGSEVFLGETISTASDSFVVVKMNDSSKVSLRPLSEVVLEKYSEESGKEEALFDLLKGGLRAISGEIGEKRPEQYRVETNIATVGIRGTDFIVRLCENDCSAEELGLGQLPQQQAGPSAGNPTKRKQLRKLDNNDAAANGSFIECKPVGEIKRGLYTAVFEGKIYVRTAAEEIELEAVEAMFVEDREILCFSVLPNFLIEDEFLRKDQEDVFTLFNILKNVDDAEQHCAIPEA